MKPIPNLLNLPGYVITDVREIDDAYHVSAKTSGVLAACPHCHAVHLVGFGRRTQWIKDLPMHGKRVALYLQTRRFRCKVCGRTFVTIYVPPSI